MNATFSYGYKEVKQFVNNTLYKNSLYMLLNRALVVITGFFFWVLAARLYSVEDVGIATVLISTTVFISSFSTLGFDISLIRFFTSYDKSKVFNAALIITIIASIILGASYIAGINFISTNLSFIQSPFFAIVFLSYIVLTSIGTITSQTFIAMRDAKYTLIQNIILTARVPLLIVLVFLGSFGIISATLVSFVCAFTVVFYLLSRSIKLELNLDGEFVRKSFSFSSGNYIANVIGSISSLVIPVIILKLWGDAEVAKFYMAYNVGNYLYQIPLAIGVSFFVEGVYGESLKKIIFKAALAIYAILIPCVIFFALYGGVILGFFGQSYVEGSGLLTLVSISSLAYVIICLFVPILNIKISVRTIILLNIISFITQVGLSYIFVLKYGYVGVGYAMILSYVIIDLVILYLVKKWKWI